MTHTETVITNAIELGIGEQLSPTDMIILTLAAQFHDIGQQYCSSVKYVESDIEMAAHSEKERMREANVRNREEHMTKGAYIAAERLKDTDLSSEIKAEVIRIDKCHDMIKIDPNYKFLTIPEKLHNEADMLWMFSIDGIKVDQERTASHGKEPMSDKEQWNWNFNTPSNRVLIPQLSVTGARILDRLAGEFKCWVAEKGE